MEGGTKMMKTTTTGRGYTDETLEMSTDGVEWMVRLGERTLYRGLSRMVAEALYGRGGR